MSLIKRILVTVIILVGAILLPRLLRLREKVYADNTTYYVSNTGSDSALGTSEGEAWQTLTKVTGTTLGPGDTVLFKRGDTWTGVLRLDESGTAGSPITIGAYGTGNAPIFRNPGGTWNRAIDIYGDYNIIEDVKLQDTSEAGVFTEIGAEHNIIRDCEGTALGQAIVLKGGYTTVTNCIFHDLVMVVNTEGGGDDFGANGIVIRSGNNELSYNTIYNAIAVSYDYGYDGGAFEMYSTNQSMDNNYIHHNITYDNMGFMEVGSQNGQYVRDNIISYNLSANNQKFLSIHLGLAGFGTQTSNMRVENNTIYEPVDTGKQIFWIWSPAELTTLSFTNNIVYSAVSFGASNQVTFTHSYNLIYMTGGASIGITPNGTEITGQNPNFVNAGADDFNLQSDSPAIDQGSVLSWTLDLDGETVPSGDGPDMGGYEYDSGYTPTPTGTPTATSTPTASLETVSISTLRSCSDLCGQNSDCQDGLICVLGYCKHPDCTTDGDCICTKYCNQGCATNDNCTSGLTCVSGYCRNGYCSSETDCACPTSVGVGGTNTSVLMESGIPLPTILMAGLATILIFISLFLAVI